MTPPRVRRTGSCMAIDNPPLAHCREAAASTADIQSQQQAVDRRESAASAADTASQQAVDQRPSSHGSARGDPSSQAAAKRELDEHGCTVGFITLEDLQCGQGSPRDSSGSFGSSSEEEDNATDPRSSEGVKQACCIAHREHS